MDVDPALEKLLRGRGGGHEDKCDEGQENGDKAPGGQDRHRCFWLKDKVPSELGFDGQRSCERWAIQGSNRVREGKTGHI